MTSVWWWRRVADSDCTRRQRGSASVLMLAWFAVVAGLVVVAMFVTVVTAAQHNVESAADLAALTAATHVVDGETVACQAAGRVAASMRSRLADCRVDGLDVEVELEEVVEVGSRRLVLRASARAGPADTVE